ncbi:MAG: hypothetical protein EKK55_17400 [Rhodocyclaceae bacterium]|nr:MAG: hypothetical protein EKK55_17400 [Rhodocyclaceae bacterium]
MARILNYEGNYRSNVPVSGGGSSLVAGALLKKGATPASMNGHIRLASGSSANPNILGILREAHATALDTNVAGTIFTPRLVEFLTPVRVVRIEISQASADLVTATQAVSTTTITLTNLEDDIDAAFLYVAAGLGVGQMNYLTASAAGSATLKAAFGTSLDTTSKLVKILPKFHEIISLSSDGTKMSSQAAAGAISAVVLDTFIQRSNGAAFEQLDPTKHSALVGLNNDASFKIFADVLLRDTLPYSID